MIEPMATVSGSQDCMATIHSYVTYVTHDYLKEVASQVEINCCDYTAAILVYNKNIYGHIL